MLLQQLLELFIEISITDNFPDNLKCVDLILIFKGENILDHLVSCHLFPKHLKHLY